MRHHRIGWLMYMCVSIPVWRDEMRGLREPRLWAIMESALFMMGISKHNTDDESIRRAVDEALRHSTEPIIQRIANDLIASGHALNGKILKSVIADTPAFTSLSGMDTHHHHLWRQIVNVAHQIKEDHAT